MIAHARRAAAAILAASCVLFDAGCFGVVGFAHLGEERRLIEDAAGESLGTEMSLHVGPIALGIARRCVGDEDARAILDGLSNVDLLVLRPGADRVRVARAADSALAAREGWTTIARIRDGRNRVLVLARVDGERLRQLLLVMHDERDQLVIARIGGDLDGALGAVLARGAAHRGAAGRALAALREDGPS